MSEEEYERQEIEEGSEREEEEVEEEEEAQETQEVEEEEEEAEEEEESEESEEEAEENEEAKEEETEEKEEKGEKKGHRSKSERLQDLLVFTTITDEEGKEVKGQLIDIKRKEATLKVGKKIVAISINRKTRHRLKREREAAKARRTKVNVSRYNVEIPFTLPSGKQVRGRVLTKTKHTITILAEGEEYEIELNDEIKRLFEEGKVSYKKGSKVEKKTIIRKKYNVGDFVKYQKEIKGTIKGLSGDDVIIAEDYTGKKDIISKDDKTLRVQHSVKGSMKVEEFSKVRKPLNKKCTFKLPVIGTVIDVKMQTFQLVDSTGRKHTVKLGDRTLKLIGKEEEVEKEEEETPEKEEGEEKEEEEKAVMTENLEQKTIKVRGKKMNVFTQEEVVMKRKKMPIYVESGRVIKPSFGLPAYQERYVPVKIKRFVYRDIEGETTSEPLKREADIRETKPIQIIEDLPKLVKGQARPMLILRVPAARNKFNAKYQFGAYVGFSKVVAGKNWIGHGIVVDFNKNGVYLSIVKVDIDGRPSKKEKNAVISVPYGRLKVIQNPRRKSLASTARQEKGVTIKDILELRTIPGKLRDIIISTYVTLFANIKRSAAVAVPAEKPKIERTNLKAEMLKLPFISLGDYLSRELRTWILQTRREEFLSEVDEATIEAKSLEAYTEAMNPIILLDSVTNIGDLDLSTDTTGFAIWFALKDLNNLTVFQARIVQALGDSTRLQNSSGYDLAVFLRDQILIYLDLYKPSIEGFNKMFTEAEIDRMALDYQPSQAEIKKFNVLHKAALEAEYKKSFKNYLLERNRDLSKEEGFGGLGGFPDLYDESKKTAFAKVEENTEIRKEVQKFEDIVYKVSGDSVSQYLGTVLKPYVYLVGPIERFAGFFKEKIAGGDFAINMLYSATLAHFLPEVFGNMELSDDQWAQALEVLNDVLNYHVNDTVYAYMNYINPTGQFQSSKADLPDVDFIKEIVKDPRDFCGGTAVRAEIKDGRYQVVKGTTNKLMEKIPKGDLIMCYDEDTNKFSCRSMRDVFIAMKKGDMIDPYTDKPYSDKILAKLTARYEEIKNGVIIPGITEVEVEVVVKRPFGAKKIVVAKPEAVPAPKVFSKKSKILEVDEIAVFGRPLQELAAIEPDVSITVGDETKTIPLRRGVITDKTNVVVTTISVRKGEDIEKEIETIKEVDPKGVRLYVIAIKAKMTTIEQDLMTKKIKDEVGDVYDVMYTRGDNVADIYGALQSVVVDCEHLDSTRIKFGYTGLNF